MMATVLGRSLRQLFVVRAVYMQVRYDEMKNMLIKVGSMLDFIGKDIPVLSVPGWMGESPTTCPWWKGVNVFLETTKFHVETLYDVLDEVCKVLFVLLIEIPQLQISKFLRILKSRLSQAPTLPRVLELLPFAKWRLRRCWKWWSWSHLSLPNLRFRCT